MKPADCIELGHGRWVPKHAIAQAIRIPGASTSTAATHVGGVLEHVKGLNPSLGNGSWSCWGDEK